MASTLVLLLTLVAAARAVPLGGEVPRCALECPVAGTPKLGYAPDTTYTYQYTGSSRVHLKGVDGGVTDLSWSKTVELTWLSPCDVAISFKQATINGKQGSETAFLEQYPLVVGIVDGRVEAVCPHPQDAPWAVNMKKGVASALQNSLPTLSDLTPELTITETDVVGRCPTQYAVTREGEKVTVVKAKNHRQCHERFPTAAETPLAWTHAPVPLRDSHSKCTQVVAEGVYTVVRCEDVSVVRPGIGMYKYVEAVQESTLTYVAQAKAKAAAANLPRGALERQSLLYSHGVAQDASLAPELHRVMAEVCRATQATVAPEAAALVAKALHLLRRVPEATVMEAAHKLRQGQYCADHARLEAILMDALGLVHQPSVVRLMAEELQRGTSGGRQALYTAALYLTHQPTLEAVEAVAPLLEAGPPSVALAAASLVNKYCGRDARCLEQRPVAALVDAVASRVQCTPNPAHTQEEEAIAALKTLANLGQVTDEVISQAEKCIVTPGVPSRVSVAAAQAFRRTPCHAGATRALANTAMATYVRTEVRIAAYLSAVRCVDQEQINEIVEKITQEENTQVRGFILSHLLNVQESTTPDKQRLRHMLNNIILPDNFSSDFRKYSQNIEKSYYNSYFGMGAGFESNIVYTPESFLPRSIDFAVDADVEDERFNVAEVGMRFEGLEDVLKDLFGPEGYIRKTPIAEIFKNVVEFAQQKGEKIMERLEEGVRTKRSIDMATITRFLRQVYGSEEAGEIKADAFARIFGHEISYISLNENLRNIDTDRMIDALITALGQIAADIKNFNIDTARTAQLAVDYALPTIQGTPLKIKLEGTAVVGLKMAGDINIMELIMSEHAEKELKVFPSVSGAVTGFVGYDCVVARAGLEMKGRIASANGAAIKIKREGSQFAFQWEIPEDMELINMEGETFLTKYVESVGEEKVVPPNMRDVRVAAETCSPAIMGLKACIKMDVPDVVRSTALPLGRPTLARVTVAKADPALKGYLVTATIKTKNNNKVVKVAAEAIGVPMKSEVTLSYTGEGERHHMSATIDSTSVSAGVWATLTNAPATKAIETFVRLNAAEIQIERGVKIAYEKRGAGAKEEYEVTIHTSPTRDFTPETAIAEVKAVAEYAAPEVKLEVIAATKNALAEFFKINMEVAADFETIPELYNIPLPIRVRKAEAEAEVAGWKTVAYVRRTTPSAEQHEAALKIINAGEDIFAAEAAVNAEGSMDEFVIKSQVIVKAKAAFKAESEIYFTSNKIGTKFVLEKTTSGAKLAEVEAMYEVEGPAHNARIMIEAPKIMETINIEGGVKVEGAARYAINTVLMKGPRTLLKVAGPVVVEISPATNKLELSLTAAILDLEPHMIEAKFESGKEKSVLAFEVKNPRENLFDFEWSLTNPENTKTVATTRLVVPKVNLKVNLIAKLSPDAMWIKVASEGARALVSIDSAARKAEVDLRWGEKKIVGDVALISASENPFHGAIHANLDLNGSKYHIKYGLKPEEKGAAMTFDLTLPSGKDFGFEIQYEAERVGAKAKLAYNIKIKDTQAKICNIESRVELESLTSPYNFAFEGELILTGPEGKESRLGATIRHEDEGQRCMVDVKINAAGLTLKAPLKLEVNLDNTPTTLKGKCEVERSARAPALAWEIEREGEAMKNVEAKVNMEAVKAVFYAVRDIITLREEMEVLPIEGEEYNIHFARPAPHTYAIAVRTPARTMEGEATIAPYEVAVKFYPNKGQSNHAYELEFKHEAGRMKGFLQALVNHPSLAKPIKVSLNYNDEDDLKAKLELDVFPEAEDKIEADIAVATNNPNTLRAEAAIRSKAMKIAPKVVLVAAIGREMLALDAIVKKSPEAPELIAVSAKIDKTSKDTYAVAFSAKTEGRPVAEIAGSITPSTSYKCSGYNAHALAHAPLLGKYNIEAQACKPAYIEVKINKHGQDRFLVARAGIQDPSNAEVSLSEGQRYTGEEAAIAMIRLDLVNPTLMNVDFGYEPQAAERFMTAIKEEIRTVRPHLRTWTQSFSADFTFEKDTQLATLYNAAKKEAKRFVRIIKDQMEGYDFEPIVRIYRRTQVLIGEVKEKVIEEREKMIAIFKEMVKGYVAKVYELIGQTFHFISTGELPEPIRQAISEAKRTKAFKTLKKEFNGLRQKYPEEFGAIEHVLAKTIEELWSDEERFIQYVMDSPMSQTIVAWLKKYFQPERVMNENALTLAETLLTDFHVVTFKTEDNQVKVQIPLYRPVYSVAQFVRGVAGPRDLLWLVDSTLPVSLEDVIWGYHTFVPRRLAELLPPYARTAMLVGGTEILTFDGLAVRVPRAPCKVLLMAYQANKLSMAHPAASARPQIELATPAVTVVVTPDLRVLVNGEAVEGRHLSHDVEVEDTAEYVSVAHPALRLVVSRLANAVAVEASGWTFGQTAGLLGTYDGEKDNDRLKPDGAEAKTFQELAEAWRQDHQCAMPAVPSQAFSVARVAQCEVMLGARSRCSVMVHPDAFLQMCYLGQDTCTATHAYRMMCSLKGVHEPFPTPC